MMEKVRHNVAFDTWRFLLCIVIILHHTGINIYSFHNLTNPYFGYGSLAVECFFVLSGFLLALSFFKKDISSLSADELVVTSFKKRIKRLYPEYIVALLLVVLITHNFSHPLPLHMFLLNVVGLSGWGGIPNCINGIWYVSVLFWGGELLYGIMCYQRKKGLYLTLPIISVLCLFYLYNHGQSVSGHQLPIEFNLLSKGTIRGILGLTVGIYCFEICSFLEKLKVVWNQKAVDFILFLGEILAFVLLIRLLLFSKGNSFNVYFYAAYITGILYFGKEHLLKFLSWKKWNKVSYLAYMIYLTHLIVLEHIRAHFIWFSQTNPVYAYSLIVLISVLFGYLAYKLKDLLFFALKKIFIFSSVRDKPNSPLTTKFYAHAYILLLITAIIAGISSYLHTKDSIIYTSANLNYVKNESHSVFLHQNQVVTKKFYVSKPKKAKRIYMRFYTWHNSYKGNLIIKIWKEKFSENPLETVYFDLNKIKDNDLTEIKFKNKIKLDKGQYFISIQADKNENKLALSAINADAFYFYNNELIKNQDIQLKIQR